jgi:hypothetical protein
MKDAVSEYDPHFCNIFFIVSPKRCVKKNEKEGIGGDWPHAFWHSDPLEIIIYFEKM